MLSSNRKTPNILFMVNNPSGYDDWISAVGPKRLVIGFAGAGGQKIGSIVKYKIVSRFLQPTTFGELDRSKTPLDSKQTMHNPFKRTVSIKLHRKEAIRV